uniref:induced myeloid leukemia cell differentiation protein Mcl-1b n=1 Tax=Scatophagus argus TaxID=75038 RepID=UPI001ED81124|nr:induced myeloid leukemia cell differentiation protein Mcl-1b [Scatophagus argus]
MNIIPQRAAFNLTTGAISVMLPQNGVVEGRLHYVSGESSPQIATDSAMDSHNANVGSSDTPKRPTILGVKAAQKYPTKSLREDSDDVDEGSLPCTPELQSDSEMDVHSCSAGDEALETDTRQLITRFLAQFTGLVKPQWNQGKRLSTMTRVVDSVLAKHRYAYNGMINRLSASDQGGDVSFVSEVATSLFADGHTNWGRIASLVAFGAVVSQYLKDKGNQNCVELVGQEISTYLLSAQRDWLIKNNAWDGFVEFFRVADPESTVRNALMAFAGVAGIGATLALLIR